MSNTIKRIIVGVIGIPLFIFIIYLGGIYFLSLTIILQTICLYEFYTMFKQKEIYPHTYLSVILSTGVLLLCHFAGIKYIFSIIVIALLFLLYELALSQKKKKENIIVTLWGVVYILIPFILLNELEKKYIFVIFIFVLVWASDTFAFFGGKLFGRHQLTKYSPKKTIEGAVTGLVFTIIISLIFYYFAGSGMRIKDAVVISIIVGIFAPAGDILESVIKRYCEVKDSSNIIPGHGGLLDRFDALIFVTPLIYIYIILV